MNKNRLVLLSVQLFKLRDEIRLTFFVWQSDQKKKKLCKFDILYYTHDKPHSSVGVKFSILVLSYIQNYTHEKLKAIDLEVNPVEICAHNFSCKIF